VSVVPYAPGIVVSVRELTATDADGAKVEQVDVDVISRIAPYVSVPVIADLCNSDRPLCLEDVEDHSPDGGRLRFDVELVLRHSASLYQDTWRQQPTYIHSLSHGVLPPGIHAKTSSTDSRRR
jgi:hypothetical protein